MAISNTSIAAAGTTIFVCPGTLPSEPKEYAVTCLIFCNHSGLSATLTVHAVPQAGGGSVGSRSANNMIVNTLTIPAGETFTFDTEKLVLTTGDSIQAVANADNRLSATVSYMRVS